MPDRHNQALGTVSRIRIHLGTAPPIGNGRCNAGPAQSRSLDGIDDRDLAMPVTLTKYLRPVLEHGGGGAQFTSSPIDKRKRSIYAQLFCGEVESTWHELFNLASRRKRKA